MNEGLPNLPPRDGSGHKGTFGTVCVLGGQAASPRVMLGGPAFAALGALRAGAGLAVLAVPQPIMAEALLAAPSATGLALPVDSGGRLQPSEVAALIDQHIAQWSCLAIGPGLGADVPQQQVVVRLISQDEKPLVIDADALNALAALRDFHRDFRCQAILTPHPGEFARLAEALSIRADILSQRRPSAPGSAGAEARASRADAAQQLAQRLGCIVVLKGAGTVVSDGINAWTSETGNAALATAGTGDVLTGIIAGLVSQFFKSHLGAGSRQVSPAQQGGLSLFDCARLGVHIHGLAADRWAARHGPAGMLATDLLNEIPDVLTAMRMQR
jgi:NAD(P)H-hydrate epimerase